MTYRYFTNRIIKALLVDQNKNIFRRISLFSFTYPFFFICLITHNLLTTNNYVTLKVFSISKFSNYFIVRTVYTYILLYYKILKNIFLIKYLQILFITQNLYKCEFNYLILFPEILITFV